ncbi:hypothetical protein [Streptomyces gobitricini]|uniref:Uncharacterized protein n=1 Tax=Streptomyces gobitricini TaxID=68211 RepID=A0ABN3LLT0_9ACTN
MTTDIRRLLATGPTTSARGTGPKDMSRRRIGAAQADLDTGPLQRLRLPDLDELRDRGVLDAHTLTD